MKLSKFLSLACFITLFSLLYVYQQTEIFRLAYMGQKKMASFEELLDKNCILRYNIEKNGSLACIGNKISDYADFQMPDKYQLVRLAPARRPRALKKPSSPGQGLFSKAFGIRRQAEAETISP